MIRVERFLDEARGRGFGLYAGVPCSYLKPFINGIIDSVEARYVGAANEGDAVAIATGAELAGTRGVAMFQNSGLGNAVNPLTSLNDTFQVPILLISSLRGDPEGDPDEPQHARMGAITRSMLELMGIPWEILPVEEDAIGPALDRAVRHMGEARTPYALLMRRGSAERHPMHSSPAVRGGCKLSAGTPPVPTSPRSQMIEAVAAATTAEDVVIATTGYTGRALHATGDRVNHFYMVGSMGCAVSLGLGIALVRPSRRVIVLDGDGAALMRLGALATVGYERPPNLIHVLLDNGVHESTGGQATVSRSIDFRAIATACGYRSVDASTPEALRQVLSSDGPGPSFVYAPILAGVDRVPPRPTIPPREVAQRLRAHLVGVR